MERRLINYSHAGHEPPSLSWPEGDQRRSTRVVVIERDDLENTYGYIFGILTPYFPNYPTADFIAISQYTSGSCATQSVTAHTLEQDLGQEYPPGTRRINNQLRHNNRPIRREGDFWVYEDNNGTAPPNYDNCSYRNGRYYFTLEDGTEEEDIWNETEAQWELAPQYREPAPVIPEDSEQEETTSESDSDSPDQTPINTRNEPLAEMSGQASTSTNTPSATVQPGRGKVKLPDNYTGDRIESQKFMLQCLLLFAAESDRYKTDQDKISLVLSCMRYGTAGAWAENFLLKSVGADPPTDLGTWKDFLAKFKLQFRETGKTDKARSALMAFSQGRMTVDEYSNQFILIAADADISDKEQVPYFQRGLDPRVMDKIYDKEVQPKDTIQDWINTACEIDG
ncbi:hypothetical protein HETIRDRAFT_120137 [Heterobasidion irregulare TC 32-1]|uniref:Retrotransposon gag domain-containing protein n=1 Tax=Heterobasidion irregulare (strain TC 32-1) TaxID=747525 RepID=W4JXV6_HETIT|nr:uncharacterized protein HETIRDRAFT_120137 [Heterobasidion irregulare TC 32-1]ETW78279.1 hypothetical protein HETIRDRAFT_120137 [Heterobasidion irregulare TC 32-1]